MTASTSTGLHCPTIRVQNTSEREKQQSNEDGKKEENRKAEGGEENVKGEGRKEQKRKRKDTFIDPQRKNSGVAAARGQK